jgi:uncharacterized protein YndB with AHSA1/START domain
MAPSATDRIEKTITLRAPLSRVWRAITDSQEFGRWFGVRFQEPFAAGRALTGTITPTEVDPEVAKLQEPYAGIAFDFLIERIEPMRLFSFRWHPGGVDPKVDYSKEPTTLVVFELREVPEGTVLKITESGFDQIPLERRAKAFSGNEAGWEHQTKLVARYLAREGR